jgi:acyl-coenzyme A thioesterase PaaI-like protein
MEGAHAPRTCILKQTLTDPACARNVTRCQFRVTPGRPDSIMAHDARDAARLRGAWQRLRSLPGGRRAFSWLVGFLIPYTGTVSPLVLELEPGFARVEMRERRRIRNHLRSVHAVALVNLAEFTSGLALTAGLPDTVRGIVRSITIEYTKKARGTLVAESRSEPPAVSGPTEYEVVAVVRDATGDAVATARVRWLLDLRAPSTGAAPPTP